MGEHKKIAENTLALDETGAEIEGIERNVQTRPHTRILSVRFDLKRKGKKICHGEFYQH